MTDLTGRVAFVTGGGSGLGRASAIALARAGATVVVGDIDRAAAEATVEHIAAGGSHASAVRIDVGDPASCETALNEAAGLLGALHVLHNSAGVAWPGHDGQVHRIDPAVWDDVIRINLSGTFYCCHYAFPHLSATGNGSIINTASSMAVLPNGTLDAYAASKGGVAMLTRSMAMGAGRRGVRANAICPGYVDTPINGEFGRTKPYVSRSLPTTRPDCKSRRRSRTSSSFSRATRRASLTARSSRVIAGGRPSSFRTRFGVGRPRSRSHS